MDFDFKSIIQDQKTIYKIGEVNGDKVNFFKKLLDVALSLLALFKSDSNLSV